MKRFDCLKILKSAISDDTVTITSFTGNAREWYFLRGNRLNCSNWNMGLCVPVAVGFAAARPDMKVVAIDSDGSFLLDIGVLASASKLKLKNLLIIVFDNEMYATHGPTATADGISIEKLAKAVDIRGVTVRAVGEFEQALKAKFTETMLIVAKVEAGVEKLSGAHEDDLRVIKEDFVKSLRATIGSDKT
jgi:sulfopyruvate decarboxylase subunit beta